MPQNNSGHGKEQHATTLPCMYVLLTTPLCLASFSLCLCLSHTCLYAAPQLSLHYSTGVCLPVHPPPFSARFSRHFGVPYISTWASHRYRLFHLIAVPNTPASSCGIWRLPYTFIWRCSPVFSRLSVYVAYIQWWRHFICTTPGWLAASDLNTLFTTGCSPQPPHGGGWDWNSLWRARLSHCYAGTGISNIWRCTRTPSASTDIYGRDGLWRLQRAPPSSHAFLLPFAPRLPAPLPLISRRENARATNSSSAPLYPVAPSVDTTSLRPRWPWMCKNATNDRRTG